MPADDKINYVEFPSRDLAATKAFFETVFGWSFQDFGPDYSAFTNQGLDGGFFKSEMISSSVQGAALVVLFSHDLEASLLKVTAGGGTISKEIFSFPGGRRFHFTEPGGSELAVWSDGE
ncbi:VOC family protein [Thalassomonas actiniarum]|uniref:VOC family protein n=1 Tax=Thalassomonas actiniarum TaxID=485447 RepID=A0AAF0C4W7_9GAMM|nr:VOC family protein [Thalassomonas actiniarum]WDE02697.1 VOC family protein [Thalassomonas actiniarum]